MGCLADHAAQGLPGARVAQQRSHRTPVAVSGLLLIVVGEAGGDDSFVRLGRRIGEGQHQVAQIRPSCLSAAAACGARSAGSPQPPPPPDSTWITLPGGTGTLISLLFSFRGAAPGASSV